MQTFTKIEREIVSVCEYERERDRDREIKRERERVTVRERKRERERERQRDMGRRKEIQQWRIVVLKLRTRIIFIRKKE